MRRSPSGSGLWILHGATALRHLSTVELPPRPAEDGAATSKTYETALSFEAKGFGWSYGDKPTFVLTKRALPRTRDTVEFYSGDLAQLVNGNLRRRFRSIWVVGGGAVSGECLRLGLADELRYSILPVLIGTGIPFFDRLDSDVALHLAEVKAYKSGMVELRYEVRSRPAID